MDDDLKKLNDKKLRQALVNFLGERSETNLFAFFDLLRESKVLAPAQIEGLSEEQAQELKSSGQVKLQGQLRIKNSCLMAEGKKYLPLFTCRAELEKGPKCNCIAVPVSHFQKVLEGDPEIVAVLVDPFSKPNLSIPRERLAAVVSGAYRHQDEVQQVKLSKDTRIVEPEPFPQELAGSLYVLLDNLAGVERAWLLKIDEPERKNWLVVVDFHDIRRDTLTAMLTSAAKKHGQGLPLAVMALEGEAARDLVEGKDPFFVNGDRQTGHTLLN